MSSETDSSQNSTPVLLPCETHHSGSNLTLHDHRKQPESLPVKVGFQKDSCASDVENNKRDDEYNENSEKCQSYPLKSQPTDDHQSTSKSNERLTSYTHLKPSADVQQRPYLSSKKQGSRLDRSLSWISARSSNSKRSIQSLHTETEKDVCFPVKPKSSVLNGIDFNEIVAFCEADGNKEDSSDEESREFKFNNSLFTSGLKNSQSHGGPKILLGENNNEGDLSPNDPGRGDEGITFGGAYEAGMLEQERFSFFSTEAENTIYAYDFPSLVNEGQSFKEFFEQQSGTWWLDCFSPTDAEMKMLTRAFGLHPLTAEDIRDQETREKIELFKSYYFVCFHTFDDDKESENFLEPINVYIVVFKDGIMTFHYSPLHHPTNVRRRIRQLHEYFEVSADWICYAIIDDITDSFGPIIRSIEYEADAIEDSVFVAREADFSSILQRIGESRRLTMTLIRLLSGKADVIKMYAKRCNEHWNTVPKNEIVIYLSDIQDHIVTMFQNLLAYEKIFSRSHANYLAQLQVESFNANNRTTEILSRVTLIGTILVPLNLVTGLFGMNVKVPGMDGSNLGWFFGIIGFLCFIIVIFAIIAKYWLFKPPPQPVPVVSTPYHLRPSSLYSARTISSSPGTNRFEY